MAKKMLSEEVIKDLEDFIANPVGIVLFAGPNGRGKSFAARYIYSRISRFKLPLRDWDQAWFINQTELNIMVTKEQAERGHSMGILTQAQKTQFLVLDDLGTRAPSVAFTDFLYGIADLRYEERETKGTIITTNLSSTKIREQFGDAFFSRMASGRNYIFEGPDRRFEELGF